MLCVGYDVKSSFQVTQAVILLKVCKTVIALMLNRSVIFVAFLLQVSTPAGSRLDIRLPSVSSSIKARQDIRKAVAGVEPEAPMDGGEGEPDEDDEDGESYCLFEIISSMLLQFFLSVHVKFHIVNDVMHLSFFGIILHVLSQILLQKGFFSKLFSSILK